MSKVYVINKSDIHDYSAASCHGELVAVTEGSVPIFKIDVIVDMLKKRLEAVTEEDYILLSGQSLLVAVASTMLFKKFDTVKFLVFDAKQNKYAVRHVKYNTL